MWQNQVREIDILENTFQYELRGICTNRQSSNSLSDGDLQASYYVDAAACWTDVNDDSGMSKSYYTSCI